MLKNVKITEQILHTCVQNTVQSIMDAWSVDIARINKIIIVTPWMHNPAIFVYRWCDNVFPHQVFNQLSHLFKFGSFLRWNAIRSILQACRVFAMVKLNLSLDDITNVNCEICVLYWLDKLFVYQFNLF